MELFIVENQIVRPHPETLLLPCYNKVWTRDETPSKGYALSEFKYVEFMCSPKKSNPFRGYKDDVKPGKIISTIFPDTEWEPDEVVFECMKMYMEFFKNASPSLAFFNAAKVGAEKLQDFFTTFDMNERNERSGAPLYKPSDVTNALKGTADVLRTLSALDKRVQEDIYDKVKNKGSKEINQFER